jgi:xanthine/uracil permease
MSRPFWKTHAVILSFGLAVAVVVITVSANLNCSPVAGVCCGMAAAVLALAIHFPRVKVASWFFLDASFFLLRCSPDPTFIFQ